MNPNTKVSAGTRATIDEMRKFIDGGGGGNVPGKKVIGQADVDDDGKLNIYNTTMEKLGGEVNKYAIQHLKPALSEAIAKITAEDIGVLKAEMLSSMDEQRTDLFELANQVRPIELITPKGKKKVEGVQHNQFENLLKVVGTGQAVLLVGPAGTGKTHGAASVADAFGLEFYSIAVGSQTSKSDLVGYMDANHNYVTTQFRESYEKGGLFLLDEADAGNSNVLILLNAALSNGYMAFPDAMVKRHEDFRMVATANTYGHGASRQYVGRNQLDAATLDRFVTIAWDIDDKIESNLAGTSAEGRAWLSVVKAVRKRAIEELVLRVVISPRATQRGALLLAAGMPFEDVLPIALTGNIPGDERAELVSLAQATWTKATTKPKVVAKPKVEAVNAKAAGY
jgi:MoxR-like ATPase